MAQPALPAVGMDTALDPELEGPRDRRGQAPRLERAGRIEALVLDVERRMPDLPLEPAGAEEGSEALAQAELEGVVADGQELPVAPHRRLAAGEAGGRDGGPGRVEVVAGQERLLALGTEVPEPVRVEPFAAQPAFEVRQEAPVSMGPGSFLVERFDDVGVFLLDDVPPDLEGRRDLARADLEVPVEDGDLLDPLVGSQLGRHPVDLVEEERDDLRDAGRARPGPGRRCRRPGRRLRASRNPGRRGPR